MKKGLKSLRVIIPALLAVQLGFSFTTYGPVKSGASMWGIAHSHAVKGVSVDTMIKAIVRLNPQAFAGDKASDLRVGARLVIPTTRTEVDQALSGRVSQSDLKAARSGATLNAQNTPSMGATSGQSKSQSQSMSSGTMSSNNMSSNGMSSNGMSSGSSANNQMNTSNASSTSMGGTGSTGSMGNNANGAQQSSMGADTDQVSSSSQVQTVSNTSGAAVPSSDVAAMPMSTDVATLQQQLTAANAQIQTLTQKMATMSAQASTDNAASGSHAFWVWFWFVLFVLSAGGLGVLWSKKAKEGDASNFFDRMTGSEKKNSER